MSSLWHWRTECTTQTSDVSDIETDLDSECGSTTTSGKVCVCGGVCGGGGYDGEFG